MRGRAVAESGSHREDNFLNRYILMIGKLLSLPLARLNNALAIARLSMQVGNEHKPSSLKVMMTNLAIHNYYNADRKLRSTVFFRIRSGGFDSGPNTYWPMVVNSNEAIGNIHEIEAFGVALVNVQVLNV